MFFSRFSDVNSEATDEAEGTIFVFSWTVPFKVIELLLWIIFSLLRQSEQCLETCSFGGRRRACRLHVWMLVIDKSVRNRSASMSPVYTVWPVTAVHAVTISEINVS